jgi:hypothetical protein
MAQLLNKQRTTKHVMFSIDNDIDESNKKQRIIADDEETDVFDIDATNVEMTWKQANAYFNIVSMFAQQDQILSEAGSVQKYENIKEILEISIRLVETKLASAAAIDQEEEKEEEEEEEEEDVTADQSLGEYSNFEDEDSDTEEE